MGEFDFDEEEGGLHSGQCARSSAGKKYMSSSSVQRIELQNAPNKRAKRFRLNSHRSKMLHRSNERMDESQGSSPAQSPGRNRKLVNALERRNGKRNDVEADHTEDTFSLVDSTASVSSVASSNVFKSTSMTMNDGKRKKRHRLNNVIGSNATKFQDIPNSGLEGANDEIMSDASAAAGIIDKTSQSESQKVEGSKVVDAEKEDLEIQGPMKPPPSSVRCCTKPLRRRKRKLPGTSRKKKVNTEDFSSSRDECSGSSSFLSSPKSSLASSHTAGRKVPDGSLNDFILVEPGNLMTKTGIHFDTPPGSPSDSVKNFNLMMLKTMQKSTDAKYGQSPTHPPSALDSPAKDKFARSQPVAINSPAKNNFQRQEDKSRYPRKSSSDRNKRGIIPAETRKSMHESTGNNYDFAGRSPQSSQANSSIVSCGSEKVFTGAGTDVYAIQDAGSHQLLLDDCNFFCSSFMTGVGAEGNESGVETRMSKHNSITAHAACDMAVVLSSKKNRGIVMSSNSTVGGCAASNSKDFSNALGDHDILQSIFSIIGFVPEKLVRGSHISLFEDNQEDSYDDELINWDDIISETGSISSKDTDVVIETSKFGLGRRRIKHTRENDFNRDQYTSMESAYDAVVANALATAAFYISLDCTANKTWSASGNSSTARLFRRKVLRSKTTICGISKLILADHVVATFLESKNPKTKLGPISKIAYDDNEGSGERTIDPTSRGRRKKRRRKGGTSCAEQNKIFAILEDQFMEPNVLQSPRKETKREQDRASDKNSFDFVSDEASFNTNSQSSGVCSLSSYPPLIPLKFKQKLHVAQAKLHIAKTMDKSDEGQSFACEYCAKFRQFHEKKHSNTGYLALEALTKIMSGKYEENDEGVEDTADCGNEENADDMESPDDEHTTKSCEVDDIEISNMSNPMIFRNVMMRESGAIPYLARAMVEALEAANISALEIDRDAESFCTTCSNYLRDRILTLSSLIDGLCLLSNENRRVFCLVSIRNGKGFKPMLIPVLLKTFACFSLSSLNASHGAFADIGLAALRTLTSLTHENGVGGVQCISKLKISLPRFSTGSMGGVETIVRLLENLVNREATSQHIYDSIILCLNSLTNVFESSSFADFSRAILDIELKGTEQESKVLALTWLSKFITNQTEPFRDAVMSLEYGKEPYTKGDNGQDSDFHEDDYLITAGNGLILLSCLLGGGGDGDIGEVELMTKIKNIILAEIPGSHEGEKLILVINTLKAFCNFYRYSMGELSVAVIAPVLRLISGLEKRRQL